MHLSSQGQEQTIVVQRTNDSDRNLAIVARLGMSLLFGRPHVRSCEFSKETRKAGAECNSRRRLVMAPSSARTQKKQRPDTELGVRRFAIAFSSSARRSGRFFFDRAFLMILRRFSASHWQGGSRAVRYGSRSPAVNGPGWAACASSARSKVGPSWTMRTPACR